MAKLWLVILLTYNASNVAVGHVQVFETRNDCNIVAALHNDAPNTERAVCELYPRDFIDNVILVNFDRAIWTERQ